MNISELKKIAENEYFDIIKNSSIVDNYRLILFLKEGSFINIWFSQKKLGKYSYHWERKMIDGTIYRYDNAPHFIWKFIKSFPKHFHNKYEKNVQESYINDLQKIY